jgi:hypothetical protein
MTDVVFPLHLVGRFFAAAMRVSGKPGQAQDPHKTVTATVAINQAASQVTGLSLTAPTLDSLTGTTLGGAIVNPSGAWAPQKQIELRFSGGQFQIDASPASAMLLRIT